MPEPRAPRGGLLPAALLSLLLSACSFDYGEPAPAEAEELPVSVFYGFVHRVVDRGAKVLEIRAEVAESYAESRRMALRGVSFTEYDRLTGEPATEGRAERALIYTDSEDAEFSGSIRLDSAREEALLEAEYLAWDSAEKALTSRLDRSVTVRRSDGSWVRGAGFSADLRRRSFSFREAAEGLIELGEADSAEPAAPAGPRMGEAAP